MGSAFGSLSHTFGSADGIIYILASVAYFALSVVDDLESMFADIPAQDIVDGLGLFIAPRLTLLSGIFSGTIHPFTMAMTGILVYRMITDPTFNYAGLMPLYVGGADFVITGLMNNELYRVIGPFYFIILSVYWMAFSRTAGI